MLRAMTPTPVNGTIMVSTSDYAAAHGKSLRQVQRYLAAGVLAGAVKGRAGWSIPVDAVPPDDVAIDPRAAARDTLMAYVGADPVPVGVVRPAPDVVPPSPLGMLGTLEDAAAVLGTTVGGVRRLAADGHLVVGRYGPRGALRVFVPRTS